MANPYRYDTREYNQWYARAYTRLAWFYVGISVAALVGWLALTYVYYTSFGLSLMLVIPGLLLGFAPIGILGYREQKRTAQEFLDRKVNV